MKVGFLPGHFSVMVGNSPVRWNPCHRDVTSPQETVANIVKKRSRAANKGWYSSLESVLGGKSDKQPFTIKRKGFTKCYAGPWIRRDTPEWSKATQNGYENLQCQGLV
jgi:hypothetical protein